MVYGKLLASLVPECCPRCLSAAQGGFCFECRGEFVRLDRACGRCGLVHAPADCPASAAAWPVERIVAPFAYRDPLLGQLQAFKYAGRRALGRALGLLVVAAAEPVAGSVDVLVPVPLHAARLRHRGYNQADELAKTLARALARPVRVAGIERCAATPPQTGLAPRARLENLAGAFRVRRRLDGARIAIVDDVITTAATVNSLAAALLGAGAESVVALAVARTEPRASHRQARNT